jgi:hypothetical protein
MVSCVLPVLCCCVVSYVFPDFKKGGPNNQIKDMLKFLKDHNISNTCVVRLTGIMHCPHRGAWGGGGSSHILLPTTA